MSIFVHFGRLGCSYAKWSQIPSLTMDFPSPLLLIAKRNEKPPILLKGIRKAIHREGRFVCVVRSAFTLKRVQVFVDGATRRPTIGWPFMARSADEHPQPMNTRLHFAHERP